MAILLRLLLKLSDSSGSMDSRALQRKGTWNGLKVRGIRWLAGQLKMGLWSFKQHLRSFSGWPFVDEDACTGQSAASFVSIFLKGIWPIITTPSSYSATHSVACSLRGGFIGGPGLRFICWSCAASDKGCILPTDKFGDVG